MSRSKSKSKKKPEEDPFARAKSSASGDVHLVLVVDASGSMSGLQESVVTGVNRFVDEFRKGKGRARVSVGFFDTTPGEPRTRWAFTDVRAKDFGSLPASAYTPRGMTPLYDAITDGVAVLTHDRKKGEAGFLAIITDGHENSSETTLQGAREALARLEKNGDAVVFLGANIHAEGVAGSLGLRARGQSFNFTASAAGTSGAFASSARLGSVRRFSGAGGQGMAAYEAQASALYDSTGGRLPEEDEDDAA